MENREIVRLSEIGENLLNITIGCRSDMHEPDEQGLSATVIGDYLDNMFGNSNASGELIIALERRDENDEDDENDIFNVKTFNLADLIALARIGAETIKN